MAMVGLDGAQSTPENYRRFARLEASGRSETYAALAIWVTNEAPGVVVEAAPPTFDTAPFVLTVNGDRVAYTHPHGDWIDWTA